ncbi:glycosyltransferase [Falsiroseomonas selenitidurans]|uniref:Glycosyltransferase n=1 Tax=Falsiroseomonas selenitidurans TaxID=2716335 RepID=A0ABX1E820_9PROT|nr:glycosyltransferase [Falsiroseomonas selenitidurans]NKC33374.1 glycosyltransferase [Falsiroseomonas selenitidurans]
MSGRPLFCIADPSLRDFVGHHFSYDHAVAEAARAAGFETLVLGHRALPEAVARQAGAVPAFTDDIWAQRAGGGPLRRRQDALMRNRRFGAEFQAALPARLPPGSILLAHMLTHRQLLGLARVTEALPQDVTLVALLRYQPEMYDDGLSARAFARMRRAVAAGAKLRLASDSARLARRIGRLAGLPLEVLPIPHIPADIPPPPPPQGRPFHLVTLGNARDEKGFLEILQAIRLLRAEPGGLDGLRFTLQANDAAPAIATAIDDFALEMPPQVTLLRRALSPAAYDTLLAESDLVLLPYWRDIYEARTSGVLPEALCAGRPVICTAGTWMADELAFHGAGLLVADHDPAGLARAIRQARAAWPQLAAGAMAGRAGCRARHGGPALVRALMEPPPPPLPAEPPRRVQLLYPWPDFLERSAGASLRSNLMAAVVASQVEELRVMQDGAASPRRQGNILVESLQERRLIQLTKRLGWGAMLLLAGLLGGPSHRREALFPWLHLQRLVDPFFRRRMERLIAGSDAVLLEYGFWAGPVLRICRRLGVPCVLTAHDVIADRVPGSALLRRLTGWLEMRALRRAQALRGGAVVAVTPDDAARFASQGVQALVIPNPVDLQAMSRQLPAPARVLLERLGHELPDQPIALFVGSYHPPNLVAVARLRSLGAALAARLGPQAPLIVVAGSAAPAEEAPGFRALGRVHAVALAALYQEARLALVPLPDGTGSSLKTLEAMAAGLPVLGTSVAFRGLAVADGVQAVVADDLATWEAILPALLADPARLARIASAGRALAASYDYRRVMAGYLRLLGLPDNPPPPLPALLGAAPASRGSAPPRLPVFSGGNLPTG